MSSLLKSFPAVKPHLVIMVTLFAGAAVVGVLLLPGENERVAMLERDGSNRAALALLEARFGETLTAPRMPEMRVRSPSSD